MNQIPDYQYSENIVKIVVDSTGWYQLSKSHLENHGVSLNNADPKTFQLWNEEDEILLFVEGEQDGIFNEEDKILFRGEKNPAPINVPYKNNFYTDENIYWLTWGSHEGLRYGQENAFPSEDLPDWQKPIYFTQTIHIEKDEYFAKLGLASDKVHQQWDSFDHFFMNPPVNSGTSVDYVVQLEYPATNEFQITAEVQGMTSNTHLITMQWNENLIGVANTWEGQSIEHLNGESNENSSIPIYNGENVFTLINQEEPNEGSNYDQVYLNWVSISYERFFKTDSDYVHFETEPDQSGTMEFLVRGFNSNSIYLFKNGIARLQNFLITEDELSQTYSIRFQDNIISSGTGFHVFSDLSLDTVKKVILMEPIYSPLNEITSPYIIVAPDSFYTVLEPLEEFHTGNTIIVDDIYRQYSYGKFSPYGIKDFFRDIYLRDNGNLKAVLIAMEGENISRSSTGFEKGGKFIPSMKIQTFKYGAVSSDFWYACIVGNDLNPEFSIGRLPAENTEQMQIMVDKTIFYHLQDARFWHNNQLFIAGYETTFKEQSETLLGDVVLSGHFPRRLYIDVTSETGPYYGGTETVLNYLETGMSYINFLGHGGGAVWGDRSIMTLDALDYLFNNGKLPFVTSMTCFTGDVTNPNSLGRRMVAHENGGAGAWLGSSGVGWIINDFLLLEPLHKYLFSDMDIPIGEIINAAKVDYLASNTSYPDIAKSQVYQFNLTGDPMLKLKKNTIGEIPITPNIGEAGQTVDIALMNNSYDSVFFQIFNSDNHPIALNPQQYSGLISLSDTAESGLYHINISARTGESIVHDSGIFALTGSEPLVHLLNVEPSTATYRDSIFVSSHVSNTQISDSLYLLINGINFLLVDINSISENIFSEIIPPQNPGQTISISLRLTDSNGQSHISNEESVTILPLADYTPQSLSFFTEDSIYLKTSIENLYPSPGTVLIQIQRLTENDGWIFIGSKEIDFTGKELKWIDFPVDIPRGSFDYRVITDTNDSTVTNQNDTLITSLETRSFFVNKNHTVGINGVDVYIKNGEGLVQIIDHPAVDLSKQSDFQIFIADSLRNAVEIIAPENLSYDVIWHISDLDQDNYSIYRYFEAFNIWLPISSIISSHQATLTANGHIIIALLMSTDETVPILEASLNGQKFFKESYLTSEPVIYFTARDDNGIDHRSTGIKIWINENDTLTASQISGNGNELSIQLKPQLTSNDSSLHISVSDAAQNWSDTLHLSYIVKSELELIDYGNFPNPFQNRTWFSYELTDACDEFYMDLFTVNGRRIRRFTSGVTDISLELGTYHEILWDGRDESGVLVANGVYFYRMVGKKNDVTIESVGKVAKAK